MNYKLVLDYQSLNSMRGYDVNLGLGSDSRGEGLKG